MEACPLLGTMPAICDRRFAPAKPAIADMNSQAVAGRGTALTFTDWWPMSKPEILQFGADK